MLPGWGMPRDIWDPLNKMLAAELDLMELSWEDVVTVDGFREKALETVIKNQYQPLSLLGWSLGSLVALEIAADYPQKIPQVILIGGTSRFTIDKTSGYLAGWPVKVLEKMKKNLENDRNNTLLNFYRSMFPGDENGQNEAQRFLRQFDHVLFTQPLGSLLSGLDYLIEFDGRDKLSSITAPILLIHGEQDHTCPVAAAKYILSQVSGRTVLKVLPFTGHAPFFSHPEECHEYIKQFMTDTRHEGSDD
jgi:pimeloyl-[acyl-carrier protein] methyl ester esterase